MSAATELVLRALGSIPFIKEGDDLSAIILDGVDRNQMALRAGDVIVLAQKIVSKAEGRIVDLEDVRPSAKAIALARAAAKDPRVVELILSESDHVLRVRPGVIIVVHKLGFVCANAGIDQSNVGVASDSGRVLLLPRDPDGSSRGIRGSLAERTGVDVAVIIIDSIGRAWRNGTIGTAIGVSGIPSLLSLKMKSDLFGRPLMTTEVGVADELASAASLIMGQADEGLPVVIARGVPYARSEGIAKELIRSRETDLFRCLCTVQPMLEL